MLSALQYSLDISFFVINNSAVSVFKRLQLLSKLSKSLAINLGRISFYLSQYARAYLKKCQKLRKPNQNRIKKAKEKNKMEMSDSWRKVLPSKIRIHPPRAINSSIEPILKTCKKGWEAVLGRFFRKQSVQCKNFTKNAGQILISHITPLCPVEKCVQ